MINEHTHVLYYLILVHELTEPEWKCFTRIRGVDWLDNLAGKRQQTTFVWTDSLVMEDAHPSLDNSLFLTKP